MPTHHATAEMLMDYAAGASAEPTALLVATHLALCPACRGEVHRLEALGGAMLDAIEPTALRPGGLDAVLARLDEPAPAAPDAPAAPADADISGLLPEPLRSRLACNLRDLPWRAVTRSLDETDLTAGPPGFKTRLMRIRAGQPMPRHTHGGTEMVLVLAGGYSDDGGHYRRGDIALADSSRVHRPVADADADCLCLAVVEGGLRLAGPIGRILNLFIRY